MTEPETTPRRGRRARTLIPEAQAALEARASMEAHGEQSAAPGVRGAVAPPTADEPGPPLRKFGRRVRRMELGAQPAPSATEPEAASAEDSSAATMSRDLDGVELGGLSVPAAPDPRRAPRCAGRVVHRLERSNGRLV